MKNLLLIIGIVLVIFGVVALGYQGFTYNQKEQIAQIGDIKVTAETPKTIYFPPIVSGAAVIAGIVLIVLSRRKP